MQPDAINIKEYAILAGSIAYFVLPIDFISDVIAGVGFTDDIAVLTMGFKSAYKIFTQTAKNTAVKKAADIFGDKFDPELAARIVAGQINTKNK